MRVLATLRDPRLRVGAVTALSSFAQKPVRHFWTDIRKNSVRLGEQSPWATALARLGLALIVVVAVTLVAEEVLRSRSFLIASPNGTAGRGSLVPVVLVPVTLFLLTLSWAFALTGALHAHPVIRLVVVFLYLTYTLGWVGTLPFATDAGPRASVMAWAGGAAVLILSRFRARPALEFALLLPLVAVPLLMAQHHLLSSEQAYGTGTEALVHSSVVELSNLEQLVLPLLVFLGMGIAGFTLQAARWVGVAVARPPWLPLVALAVLLGWRSRDVLSELDGSASAYVGALGIPLAAGAVWLLVGRTPAPDGRVEAPLAQTAERLATFLIAAWLAPLVASLIIQQVASLLPPEDSISLLRASRPVTDWLEVPVRVAVAFGALAVAGWMARRGARSGPLFLGTYGAVYLWLQATRPGAVLDAVTFRSYAPVDFWWVLFFVLTAAVLLLRRRLTSERAHALFAALVVSGLLRQVDFIEDPLSPLLGFAGVGFIAIAALWELATIGWWANADTSALPRSSRLFLYLGYCLLTFTVINWMVSSHDLDQVAVLADEGAVRGLEEFGKPILYAVFTATLWGHPHGGFTWQESGPDPAQERQSTTPTE